MKQWIAECAFVGCGVAFLWRLGGSIPPNGLRHTINAAKLPEASTPRVLDVLPPRFHSPLYFLCPKTGHWSSLQFENRGAPLLSRWFFNRARALHVGSPLVMPAR